MTKQLELIPKTVPLSRRATVKLADLPPNEELVGPAPDTAMVQSVRDLGVFQPIVLIEKGKKLTVAAGRRRIKAARLAERTEIEAVVIESAGHSLGDVITLAENTQRSVNLASDLDAIERLVKLGATPEKICSACGFSRAALDSRMRLIGKMGPEVRAALNEGRMTAGAAQQAARLSRSEQRSLLAKSKDGKVKTSAVSDKMRAKAVKVASIPASAFETPSATADPKRIVRDLLASPALTKAKDRKTVAAVVAAREYLEPGTAKKVSETEEA